MSVRTLNPQHPAAQAVQEHWTRIAAILVHKAGGHVVITPNDLESLPPFLGITVQEKDDGLHLRTVDEATAHRLARENGGLPS